MKRMKKFFAVVLSLCMVVSLVACGSSTEPAAADSSDDAAAPAETVTLKIGHIAPDNDEGYNRVCTIIKEIVEEKTNGAYKIEIYPNAQLGTDAEMLEACQMGSLDMCVVTSSSMASFAPDWGVLDLPYVFASWDHAIKWMNSDASDKVLSCGDDVNLHGLGFTGSGFRKVTNNNGPIHTPDDIKGLKIRVMNSAIIIDSFNAIGYNASGMSWSEAFTAMQQGTIDAEENPILVIKEQNVQDVQKYISSTDHIFRFGAIVAGKTWSTIPADVQAIITDACKEAQEFCTQQNIELENVALEWLTTEGGMEYNDDVDRDAFKALSQSAVDKWLANAGANVQAIYDSIQSSK